MGFRLNERVQAILFLAVLIATIAGLYALTQVLQPAGVNPYVVLVVRLDVEGPGWTIRYAPIATMNNTAFSLLVEASAHLDFGVRYSVYQIPGGVLVTAINGSVNGQGQRYWQYWVNEAYARVAADRMPLHDGDVVLWRFVSSQEGA